MNFNETFKKKTFMTIIVVTWNNFLKITQNYLPCPVNQQNKKIKGWKCLEKTVCQIKQYVGYSWLLNVKNSIAQGLEVSIAVQI